MDRTDFVTSTLQDGSARRAHYHCAATMLRPLMHLPPLGSAAIKYVLRAEALEPSPRTGLWLAHVGSLVLCVAASASVVR